MFKFEGLSFKNAFILLTITSASFGIYKLITSKDRVSQIENQPSYEYSLKVKDKKITSYRSPASLLRSATAMRPDEKNSSVTYDKFSDSNEADYDYSKSSETPVSSPGVANNWERSRPPRSPERDDSDNSSKNKDSDKSSGNKENTPVLGGGLLLPGEGTNGGPLPGTNETQPESSSRSEGPEPAIAGKVPPLLGQIVYHFPNPLISSAYASTCTNPRILLLDLSDMSILMDNPITEKGLSQSTAFNFDPKDYNLNLSTPSRYMLLTKGCTTNFQRIITSFYSDQDLSFSTTLISKVIYTEIAPAVITANSESIGRLYSEVEYRAGSVTTFEDAYNQVWNDPTVNTVFTNAFSAGTMQNLEVSAPDVSEVVYHHNLDEKVSYVYSVTASHWKSDYVIAYEWKIDGVTVSTGPTWTYTPTANSPNDQKITLLVGQKNSGDSFVNVSEAYHQIDWDITINDTVPVAAPTVALSSLSSNPSSTRSVVLEVSTGALVDGVYSGCETFNSMAITESNVTPSLSDFTYTCQNAPTDNLNYTIQNASDGPIDLYVWSKDIENRISPVASVVNVVIDTTNPVIAFTNINASYLADEDATFEWSLTEEHSSSTQNFTVEFYDGSAWSTLPNVAVTDGPHTNTLYSTVFHVPNINVNNAKMRVTYTDLLGLQTIVESSTFDIQRPILGATPVPLDMGSVLNKSTSSSYTLNFTNSGVVPSRICSAVTLSGTNAAEFSIISDGCNGNTIAASGSCAVTIEATPTAKGTRSASATITCGNDTYTNAISILSLNNAPIVATTTSHTLNEDSGVVVTLGPLTDVDGDSVTYSIVSSPLNGTVGSCVVSGSDYQCTYTPSLNYNGTDSFTFKSNDGTVDSNTGTVNLSITPVNDAPTLSATQSLSTPEDTVLSFTLNAGSDVENDTLSYIVLTSPASGTLTCTGGTSTSCSYTPAADFVGSVSFTYKVNDGALDSTTATVTITMNNENDPPVIGADQSIATNEDTSIDFTINAATDIDLPAQTLTYKIITAPLHGTITNCIDGTTWGTDRLCTYTPSANYNGTDSFTVRANDGISDSVAVETITITINPVNDAPTLAATQAVTTTEDTALTFDLAAGSDIEGDTLTYTKLTNTTNGTITCTGGTSRSCTYTPNADFEGTDTFTYNVSDASLSSTSATVTITVTPANDPPLIGADQSVTTNEDTLVSFTLNSGTDIDVPAQTLSYKVVTPPTKGTLSNCINTTTYSTDIICDYTPGTNLNGTDTFTYKVYDGISDSVSFATVTINITPVNDAPTLAATQAVSTAEDTALTFDLTAGSDVEGDTLTYTKLTDTTYGTITCTGGTSRSCTYTPNADFEGSDSFTYMVSDSSLNSTTATVTITVTPANDAPLVGADQTIATNEDTPVSFTLNAGSDIDIPAQTLSYKLVTPPSRGTLSNCINTTSYTTDVICDYTPSANLNGPDTFTYRVYDGISESVNFATVTINVAPVNDAPIAAADQTYSTRDNFAYDFTLSAGSDIDTSVASLSYKLVTAPATGSLGNCLTTSSYSADLTCTYTAPVNYSGSVTFTYLVYDGALDSSTVTTVTINVSDQTSTTPNLTPYNFASNVSTSNNPITLTASSCSDISYIMIQESSTAPAAGDAGWQSCTTALGGLSFNPGLSNQQGFRTLRIYGKDPSNNISSAQLVNFIYDSMAPIIAIDNIPTLPNGISYTVKWYLTEATVSAATNFSLSYSLDNGATWATAGSVPVGQDGPHSTTLYTFDWPVPAGTYPAAQFKISLTDGNGLSTTTISNTFQILVDGNAPNFLLAEMLVNGSSTPPSTPQKYVNVSLSALDGDTDITHFCLKTVNSAPNASDSCWNAVDAPSPGLVQSPSLDLVNFPFLLGYTPATYTVYAWAKDRAGNISTNTGTVGQDIVSITFYLDYPPVLTNFFAANSTTPSNPITSADMTFNIGDPVYIKWTASDDFGVKSTIAIYYTLDDVSYHLVADSLSNNSNNCSTLNDSGTTLDDSSTGCYQWSSPAGTGQYFKLKILLEDTASQQVSATSAPLNSNNFRIFAGNTDPGVNSSAKSAIIAPTDLYSLAAASDGKVFYRDASFGLMYVNPQTGVVEQLLKVNGSTTGDNGPVRSATARSISKITMDFQDRLLVWDYDRIRRIDTKVEPMQIETIIGAYNNGPAGTETTETVTNPADLKITASPPAPALFQPLPNGDIYFQSGPYSQSSNNNHLLRVYRGSLADPRIESIRVSGTGAYNDYN